MVSSRPAGARKKGAGQREKYCWPGHAVGRVDMRKQQREAMKVQRFEVLQDWIRVENYEVDAGELRTYEFHVVRDEEGRRVTLTIKCLDSQNNTVRLDPTVLFSSEASFPELAQRRIKRLYALGLI